jgi:hypothetical protein
VRIRSELEGAFVVATHLIFNLKGILMIGIISCLVQFDFDNHGSVRV